MGSQGRKGDARKHCIPGWLCRVDGLEMAGASLAELVIKLSSASAEVETHILGKSKLTNFAHVLCVLCTQKSPVVGKCGNSSLPACPLSQHDNQFLIVVVKIEFRSATYGCAGWGHGQENL